MGRISSRYNYRISKTKKDTEKKSLPVEEVVIRNKKANKKTVPVKSKIIVNSSQKHKKINTSIQKNKHKKASVSIEDIKNYCNGKSIILVGNARDIIKNPYGKQIDSYDIVVRMNHGHPLNKYIVNMGKKYNIWAHGFLSHKRQISEYYKIKGIIDFHIETNERKLCRKIFDEKAFLIPKKWYKSSYEKTNKKTELSTGLNISMFFVNWIGTMKEISIVGFDFLKTSNPTLHSASARKFHDTELEKTNMTSLLLGSGKYIPFNKKYDFAK